MDADAVAIQSIQTQLENDKVHPVDRGPWALVGRALANVPFAAVFLAAGLVLPLALAGAMLLRGPPLDIDLSYAAFEVRNHKASRRFDALALALRSQIVMHISTLLPSRRHRHTRELQAENCSMGNADYGHDRVLTKTLKLSWPAWPCKVNNVEELIRQLNRYRARQERSTHHVRSKSRVFNSSEPSVKPYHSRLFEQIPLWAKNHGGPVRPGRFRRDTVSVQPPWQQVQPQWHMQLIFVARNGDTHHNAGDDDLNIFTPERLEVVRSVEHSVMAIPGFQEFCWRPKTVVSGWPGPKDSETPPCAPPTSLLSYLYPSEHDGKLWFDGLGSDLADVNGSLHLALTHPQTYWFVDAMLDVSNCLRSRLLRAELALGAPLPGFASTRDRPTLQRESVRSFMLGYAELLPTLSTNSVRVLYGGPDLFDNEVRETFRGDVRLAIVSATFIALLVFLLTHASLFLTVVGLGAIAVGCLLALFLYRVALSVRYLGILNGVAAFVVIGIGVDDVFVFVNAYQQTASLSSRAERLSTTLRSASRATFFTSATTAASYAANLGSQVPAVHDFGLFMAIVISCCWLFVSLLLPPALSLWSHFSEDWRLSCCRPPMRIETNPLDTSEASFPRDTGGYLDDDIPLLSASMEEDGEEECGNESPNGDVGLLHPVDEEKGKATGFVAWLSGLSWLQSALTRWMVLPAIKAKGKVLGIYMLILLLAAWAAFRLRLASHPPLLFRPETNIQSLLNLQDNLSSPAIACHTCSGLFLENPRPLHFPPAPWPPPEVPDPPDLQIPDLQRSEEAAACQSEGGPVSLTCFDTVVQYRNLKLSTLLTFPAKSPKHKACRFHITNRFAAPPLSSLAPSVPSTLLALRHSPVPPGCTSSREQFESLLRNVYISQFLGENIDEPVYRFSLDPMVPSPWQQLPPGRGNVPYFKAFARPWGNFSQRLTVCASRLGLPTGGCPAKFLLTDFSCDGRRGWSFNFSFFVALKPQLSSRRLFFAQARRFPFNSRVCLGPQGCMVAPTAKGPNRQAFYVPYAAGAVPRPPLSLRGYNPCSDGPGCGPPASRPLVDSGAIVFLVFGILGLNQSSTHENHVIGNNGRVVYDPSFDLHRELPHLCLLCKAFAANARLVVDGGAQCLPQGLSLSALPVLPSECHALPQPHLLPGQLSHAALGLQAGRVAWIAMAFKSTTPHGRPAFQALTDYLQWENFLKEQLTNLPPDSALRHGFHTCQHWKQVFIEVLGIQGSLQSLGLSMGTCFLAIMIFTSHPVLLLTVMSTILGVLAVMVLFLWLVGGEFGAVEAISLSIVIGSSVDYSLHLVECYIHSPVEVHMTPRAARAQCAANQICLPIFSSGLTTVASALPLLFCTIAPFACFGRALSIAAVASLAGALILGPAILAFIGPSNFKRDGWAISKALTIGLVTVMIGFGIKAALGWSSDDEPVAERTLGVLT